jgi:hypothetical protein
MKTQIRTFAALILIGVGLTAALLAYAAPTASTVPAADYPAPIVQDSWIDANQPDANFGGDTSLHVGLVMDPATGRLGERQTLVQFDLSGLPAGATIVTATLQLYQTAASGSDAYQIRPDAALASWQEAAVTWNSRPATGNLGDPALTLDYASGWKQWDVTQIVRAWQTGRMPNYGIVLVGLNVGVPPSERVFASRNATAWPTLTIVYEGGATATSTHTSTPTASPTKTPTPTSTPTHTQSPTPTATPSPTATRTPTTTPSPTVMPTLIPIVQPTPFVFQYQAPCAWCGNPVSFTHARVTQGLEEDLTGNTSYDRIAGKDTLARFWLKAAASAVKVTSAACQVYYWNGSSDVLMGTVPGVMGWNWIYTWDTYPSTTNAVNCWIPGSVVNNEGWYKIRAIVNDSDGRTWQSTLGGYRLFLPTADYFGLFLFPLFIPSNIIPEANTHPFLTPAELAHLTGITMQTFQRVQPLRSGIEAISLDGLNQHVAGLRYYLSPNPLTCQPSWSFDQCNTAGRAEGNRQLNLFNLWAWWANTFLGKHVDYLHWGELVAPQDHTGGGQSCWSGQRIGGQGISLDDIDGGIMVQEVAHCQGLVWVGPHANPADHPHSATRNILMWPGQLMVNFRNRQDYGDVWSVMNGILERWDDQLMMEGFEWNRLRGIFLGSDPCGGGGCAQAASLGTNDQRFFLSGTMDPQDHWTTDLSMIITAPVPLPPTPPQGEYAVVVLNNSNTELARWPFDVSFAVTHDEPPPFVSFDFIVPYPQGATAVRVVHGSTVLAELRPPAQGPSVAFQSVTADSTAVDARWTASHPNGAPLTYSLYFSPDDGATRMPIATALTTTSYLWPTALAQGTTQARLIVVASDGFHTAEATSSRFSIPRKPPVAAISAPVVVRNQTHGTAATDAGIAPQHIITGTIVPQTLIASQPLYLRGSGYDLNDGLLDGQNLRWASSVQGPLGIGQELTVRLQPGIHTLVLQAISSAGLIGSDSITVTVLADGDGDSLPDVYEQAHACLNANAADDTAADQDRDGLNASAEYQWGTDPCVADTDGDGYGDGAEVEAGSNPLDRNSVPLPPLAQAPAPLRFGGCGLLPPPAAQTIPLSSSVVYSVTTDAPWLHAVRRQNGDLHVSVTCADIAGDEVIGSIMLTAGGRQPLRIEATLTVGTRRLYLPIISR